MDRTPLPPAVREGKQFLSASAQSEIAALTGARPGAFTFQLVFAWMVIFGIVAWAVYLDTIWATIVAVLVVATRHNVLGLLVHDQAHFLGYRGRYGDLMVDLFAAYPLVVLSVEGYAQVHLAHHRDYFGGTDPDSARKSGEEWSFPKTPLETAKLFLADLTGINTLRLIRGKRPMSGNPKFARRYPVPKWVRPLYLVLLASALTVTGGWGLFLLYWVLPIVTVSQVIVRWGAICEHKYNLEDPSVAESTPLIVLSWWERLLLPNLNFAMHPYHHYFPGVSFSLLPRIHEIYCREGLVNHDNVFRGYRAYLGYVTGRRREIPAE